ncbi:MAG: hypothetical protein GY822_10035 [Deltaproteobacteria bacterium]|nr:hypothetical protein [Deltaproteobacteria bacterium]
MGSAFAGIDDDTWGSLTALIPSAVDFPLGVASGDALPDAMMLWTRVGKTDDAHDDVQLVIAQIGPAQ